MRKFKLENKPEKPLFPLVMLMVMLSMLLLWELMLMLKLKLLTLDSKILWKTSNSVLNLTNK
jgi:hypothetical protein